MWTLINAVTPVNDVSDIIIIILAANDFKNILI